MVSELSPPGRGGGRNQRAGRARIAGYQLEKRIGAGGMAVVYRAYDERLQRRVALKLMSAEAAVSDEFRVRFLRESRAAAAVDDPHIIPVYEAGEEAGVLFIAMRYVAGGDVHALVRETGPLSARRAMAIISPVALALDSAHAAGLVHRDVKPANILIDRRPGRPDHVYLSDFGLSKRSLAAHGLTASGQFLGTVDYCAPEQMRDNPTDGRADQYSLACTAFELLTGSPPFPRELATAIILAHVSEPPPSLRQHNPGFAPAADAVLARALAKEPSDRYASCAEFADALRRALGLKPYDSGPGESPLLAASPPPAEVAGHRTARHARIAQSAKPPTRPPAGAPRRDSTAAPVPRLPTAKTDHGAAPAPRPETGRAPLSRRKLLIGGAAGAALIGAGATYWAVEHHAATIRWQSPIPPRLGDIGPAIVAAGQVVCVQGGDRVAALRATDGTHLWTYPKLPPDPAAQLGLVASATPEAVFVLWGGVVSLDPRTGRENWAAADYNGYALRTGAGNVYVSSADSVIALEGSRGGRLWMHQPALQLPPAVYGNSVYIVSDDPKLGTFGVVSALSRSGEARWTMQVREPDRVAALAANAVIVTAAIGDELQVWRGSDGTQLLAITAGAQVTGIAQHGSVIYATTVNNQLVALNLSSGKTIWQQPASSGLAPTVANGMVYAGTPDQGIVARKLSDGGAVWQTSGISFATPPLVVGRTVYAADSTTVYALQA